ncbi:FACT complex subunit [Phlyctochytrium planicorne]|nr:FACT complex subunit [Phlyctochytrium planicorne]
MENVLPASHPELFGQSSNAITLQWQSLGKLKLAEPGIGFQDAETKTLLPIPAGQIRKASWYRCSRDFELRVELDNGIVHKFDGFQRDSFEVVEEYMRLYGITLEEKDLALRGYNWGKCEFQGSYMTFNVGNKPAFEVPLVDVAGATLSGKHEVSLELVNPVQKKEDGTKMRPPREDIMVEIQFFIPGMVTASQVDDSGVDGKKLLRDKDSAPPVAANGKSREEGEINEEDEELVLGDDGEAISAASIFCETIKNRADVSVSQGESIVTFPDVLCLTPRGRFEIDMHATFFRLRGKSHDYRILYSSIRGMFMLPKPDDLHYNFVIRLEPPLRQGQTRYPFLVFQFDKDEEAEFTVKLDEETITAQYGDRLKKNYDDLVYSTVGAVFKGLTNGKLTVPTAFKSAQNAFGLKCSLKANEAMLFPLEKSFISLPKPTTLIPHTDITMITFGRVNASASSSTKTFEMKISTDSTDYTYSSIPRFGFSIGWSGTQFAEAFTAIREEYENLDAYCKSKKLRVSTDVGDGPATYQDDDDDDSDDASDDSRQDDRKRKRTAIDINAGDLDDEDESEDEDYVEKSDDDSDLDLEFDSDANTGSDSSDSEDEKPKKKSKDKGKEKEDKKSSSSSSKKKKAEEPPAKKKSKSDNEEPKKATKESSSSSSSSSKKGGDKKEKASDASKIKSEEFVGSDDD